MLNIRSISSISGKCRSYLASILSARDHRNCFHPLSLVARCSVSARQNYPYTEPTQTAHESVDLGNTSKSRFLPYTEARDYVRGLGLKSRKDYDTYWQRDRPKFLPCQPKRVYGKSFVNYEDFCGFERHQRRKRFVDPRLLSDGQAESFVKRFGIHEQGVSWLMQLICDFAPRFKLEATLGNTQVKFLCKRRDYNSQFSNSREREFDVNDDRWIPFCCCVSSKIRHDGAFRFVLNRNSPLSVGHKTSWILSCENESKIYMFSSSTMEQLGSYISIMPKGKYKEFEVTPSTIGDILESWWESEKVQKITKNELQSTNLRTMLLTQTHEKLYKQAGLTLISSTRASSCDSLLGNKKLLHRSACFMHNNSSGYQISLIRKASGVHTCHDVDVTDIDFFVALFHTNQILTRIIFLPREVLSIMLRKGNNGEMHNKKTSVLLYPSTIKPGNDRSRRKQEVTLPYEIDLQQPLLSVSEKEKFLRILGGKM